MGRWWNGHPRWAKVVVLAILLLAPTIGFMKHWVYEHPQYESMWYLLGVLIALLNIIYLGWVSGSTSRKEE